MLTFLFNLAEGQISIIWLLKYFQVIISIGFSARLAQASTSFLLKYVCASFFKKCLLPFCFQEEEGASTSCSPHSFHTSNILRILSWFFQDNDSYKHPTPSWSELNSLKTAHKWAIHWPGRKALQGSISVHVTANENRADSARHKWSSQTPQVMESKTVLCATSQSLSLLKEGYRQ